MTPQELKKAKKNAIPLKVDLTFLEEQYINKTIQIFLDKEFDEEVRSVLVTAYTALTLIENVYKNTLENSLYIEKLKAKEFLTTKSFEDLFDIKVDKQKTLRSRIHDKLPCCQTGENTNILYHRETVSKWFENYTKNS